MPTLAAGQQGKLDQIRDSLSRNSSVPELRNRETALSRGPNATEPAAILERGLVLLRLFELTKENGDGDAARKAFERAVEHDPASGWAHFGLGLALAGGPGVRVPSPGGVLDGFVLAHSLAGLVSQDPRSRAGRQFLKAIELDPSLAPAAVHLADLALELRSKDMLRQSSEALQRMVADGFAYDDVTTALSRVQAALGDVAGAEATVAAAAASDRSTAGALRAHAEALLRQPGKADAGAKAYFEGLAKADDASIVSFFDDLRIIASESELAGWEQRTLDSRRAWLQHFWDKRAASSGKTIGERMAEHYRRLAEAQTRYRREGKRGASPGGSLVQDKFDLDQLPFDERGLIYVRHGQPERVIRTSNADLRANESWVYTLPSGKTQLYHFVVLRDGTDYRMVDDLLQAMDPSSAEMPYEGIVSLLEDRGPYDQRYNILANRFNAIRNNKWGASSANTLCQALGGTNCMGTGSGAARAIDGASSMMEIIAQSRINIANENREAALDALARDSDRPDFKTALPFYYDVYMFKGAQRKVDLTAAIAIPGTSLEPRQIDDVLVYSLQLSFIVIDTMVGSVTRRDTVYHFRSPRRLGKGEHLRVHTDLSATASRSTVHRLVIRDLGQDGRGQMYGGNTVVTAYDGTGIQLSDIVLAEPEKGSWQRGTASLALVPPRQFLEGQPLTLFYEVYNLPADTPYRTEITLAPTSETSGFTRLKKLFGGSDGSVQLRFDGVAVQDDNGRVQEIRRVTTELKPGKYRVRLNITNLSNQQAVTSEKQFVVIKR
ncbi:MAG: GWxTD domain-containing protein [Gemmatimonadota bacterium]